MRTLAAMLFLALLAPMASAEHVPMTRIIHQQKSMYRNILVAEGGSTRCMSFGLIHGRQTCVDLADPSRLMLQYTQAVMAGLFAAPNARRVLVIGLGGGAVPTALRALDSEMTIDSVEVDPAVAAVAHEFFGFQLDERMRVHIDDGRVYVRRALRQGAKFDLIVIDAFEKQWAPEHMQTVDFYRQIRGILAPDGVVVANTYATGPLQAHEAATYQAAFGELYRLDVDVGNRVLMASASALPSIEQLRASAATLHERLSLVGVDANALAARIERAPTSHATVMTDAFSPVNLLFGDTR